MINNKNEEKQQKPRLFELWDEIVNGSEEKKKEDKWK
jgi:hypothetical protein